MLAAVFGVFVLAAAPYVETEPIRAPTPAQGPRVVEMAIDLRLDPASGNLEERLGSREAAYALRADAGGELTAAGRQQAGDGRDDFLAVSYNADGTLRTEFGTGGSTTVSFEGSEARAYALTLQEDRRIARREIAGARI